MGDGRDRETTCHALLGDLRNLLLIGSTVSRYRLLELLAGEEPAVVYRARDTTAGDLLTVELVAPAAAPGAAERGRLLAAARRAAAVADLHLCPVREVGEVEDGALFVATEVGGAEPLAARLGRGPLGLGDAVDLASQVAAGLAAAHAAGVVHGRLDPSRVWLEAKVACLSGMGLDALPAGRPSAYRSPEQWRGEPAGPAADVWSLGVLLYAAIAGRVPFEGTDEAALRAAVLHGDPPPLDARRGVPAEVLRVVALALAKRPAERYPSAVEALADLRRLRARSTLPPETEPTIVEVPKLSSGAGGHAGGAGPGAGAGAAGTDLVGSTVAHYRILERLGSGGMGVVYQASDSKLERTVALKFLPPELTRDAVAKQRFLREARTASGLDHPNVCTIHEVGETAEGQLYIAMACYDGETLATRIERGPLPVAEAVDIARQVALGLEKAHRRGIVHRDVKPANLMLTGDGIVKILDFGIAKLADAAAQVPGAGFAVGTPAYMSPEQARGAELDPRTDLWSLGVVLYEMLAGRTPFRRGTGKEAIQAVLEDPPRPLAELRPETPPELLRVVARLLAKPLAERYASATELLADLDALAVARPARGPRWWAVAAVVAAAAALGSWLLLRGGASGPIEATFHRATDQEGMETFPSLAPDDSFVYVHADRGDLDLFLERPGGGEPANLTAGSPADDTQPAFSPDGRRIAFRSERDGGGIFLLDLAGGPVRRLAEVGFNPAWSPDGRELVVATEGVSDPGNRTAISRLLRIEVASGRRRDVETGGDAVQPSWSPHGARIAYWGLPPGGGQRVIWTVRADGGDPVRATGDEHVSWNPVWSPDGKYLYFASDRSGSMSLWRVAIDERSGVVRGEPRPITTFSQWSGLLSLSRDGRRILYASDDGRSNLQRVGFDPEAMAIVGTPEPVTQGTKAVRSADVSPDGRWLAFDTSGPREDLFRVRPDGSGVLELTNDLFKDRIPHWSRDGRSILFYSNRNGGRYDAWTVPPEGGPPKLLLHLAEGAVSYPIWSPDGKRLAASINRMSAVIDLPGPGERPRLHPLPPAGEHGEVFAAFSWSPDGGRISGILQQQGEAALPGIVLYSLAARSYRRLTARGTGGTWMPDGRSVLYVDAGSVFAADVKTGRTWLLAAPPPQARYQWVSVAPDRRTLYLVTATEQGDICRLTLAGS